MGGRAVKLNPLGWVGIPDRLVLLSFGVLIFVELKRPKGGVVSKAQTTWHRWLEEHGFWIEVAYTKEQVDELLRRAAACVDDRARRHGGGAGDA